jgi:hypothetical protein
MASRDWGRGANTCRHDAASATCAQALHLQRIADSGARHIPVAGRRTHLNELATQATGMLQCDVQASPGRGGTRDKEGEGGR